MKKLLITTGVAVLALATLVSAQGYQFGSNLTVGSTGADVSALQTWLISSGFSIPSIASGAATKGYFGSQTKAAVQAYQTSKSIPSTGFVGPLTRAALNGSPVAAPVAMTTCPAGFVCTPVAGTPVVTATPGSITTPGVAGTLTSSLQATPSNGTSLSKGQEADIATYKLQSGSSDMQLSSLQLDFDARLWLYASSITVLDGSTVVAQKSGLNVNDFVEITVGSKYRLTVPTNYIVAKGSTRYLTVHIAMLPVSDRSSATISITQAIFRSVDGTGVTTSDTNTSTRSFSYTGSNNGQIVVTVGADSPLQSLVQISTANQTDNVPLAVYNVKSQNIGSTLRSLTLRVNANAQAAVTSLFGDIKIKVNGHWYSADSIGNGAHDTTASSTVVFTNMTEPLSPDVYTPVWVYGKINQDTNGNTLTGAVASTSWVVAGTAGGSTNNPSSEDASYTALAVNSGIFVSSDLTFSASSAVLSNLVATLGAPVVNSNTTTAYPVAFSFTMAAGNNTLYVSAQPGAALSTSTTGYTNNTSTNASSTLTDMTANPGTVAGDVSGSYFVVPAGSSRSFTFNGQIKTEAANTGLKTFSVTAVKYGTTSGSLTANTINYNLNTLKVSPVF